MRKPVIAIVGRPNIGKSTLFNRLLGRLTAIVSDLPGTTRDRLYAEAEWHGNEVTVIDTGGIILGNADDMAEMIYEQVEAAMEEADIIFFMVDAREGLTALDFAIAERLRRFPKPVLLVANKVDHHNVRESLYVLYELGVGDPLPISAYHGTGIDDLMDRAGAILPASEPGQKEELGTKVAIVGRPNVGKSLFLNSILGEQRAIVSEKPGTTRDALDVAFDWEGHRFILVDTAGIRRRGRIEPGVERYSVLRSLRAIDRAEVALLLIDAVEGLTAQDTHIAGYVHQVYKGIVVVINKWDLIEKGKEEEAEYRYRIQKDLQFMPYAPILFASAKFGTGIDEVLATVIDVVAERQKRIHTALLNTTVEGMIKAHNPPREQGRSLKVLYVTQTSAAPPTFVFFVNDPRLIHFSYERYLENRLREAFGFRGTPLHLIFRGRRSKS